MLYINGRFLTQQVTGVQRFALEISKELIKVRDDIIFLVPHKKLVSSFEGKCNIEVVSGKDGHYWEQLTLPMFLKKNNDPLLLNLCSTAPAFYNNQVVTHHDITYKRYPKSFSLKFRLLYGWLVPKILKNSKKIITVSNFSKNEISNFFHIDKNKIDVIYNAVGQEFHTTTPNRIDKEKPYALAVSSPNYHKNFHGLIDAFLSTEIDLNLKIIGGGAASFKKMNFSNEDDPRIHFLGRVDDDKLIQLYMNAEFFIFPSFYEGFGIPPLEAQACGCPVIASNAASMPEVLEQSVLYFSPHSKHEMQNALLEIYNDAELRVKLKKLGVKNSHRFSWKHSAEKINLLLEELEN